MVVIKSHSIISLLLFCSCSSIFSCSLITQIQATYDIASKAVTICTPLVKNTSNFCYQKALTLVQEHPDLAKKIVILGAIGISYRVGEQLLGQKIRHLFSKEDNMVHDFDN